MKDQLTLVIASSNPGKTAEITDLLTDYPICIKNLADFGPIPPVVEDGETFEENAYKNKIGHCCAFTFSCDVVFFNAGHF